MRVPGDAATAAELARRLTDGAQLAEPLGLGIGGCRVDLLTDELRLRRRLEAYFRAWIVGAEGEPDFRIVAVEAPAVETEPPLVVKPPDPGKTRIKEEFFDFPDGRLVRKRLTGMVFVFGGDLHVAYGPCLANDNQIVNFVNNRYMQWRIQRGYILCHAGAVARDGRGLAVCGASGAGKSTASLGLVTRGLDFVSNDRVLLKPDRNGGVEIQGIPKHPRVNPGTLLNNEALSGLLSTADRVRYEGLSPEKLSAVEHKHDVLIDDLVGPGRFPLTAQLHALVVIAWNGDGPPRLRRVDLAERPDLLVHVMKSPGLFYEPEGDDPTVDLSPGTYVDVLSRRPTWEITGARDFDAVEELCLQALDADGQE